MFRFIIYRENKTNWTSQKFTNWEETEISFDLQLENLNGTGGNIEQFVDGIGWVLCNENPEGN